MQPLRTVVTVLKSCMEMQSAARRGGPARPVDPAAQAFLPHPDLGCPQGGLGRKTPRCGKSKVQNAKTPPRWRHREIR